MNNLLTSFFFVESIFWKHIFVKHLTIKLSIINYIIVNNKIVYKKIFYYRIFDAVFQKFSLINIFNISIYDKYIYRWALFTLFVHFALFHIFPEGGIWERNRSTVKILREIEKHGKVHTFSVYTFRFSMQQRQITAPRGRNTILLTVSPINFTEIWNRFEIYGMAEVQPRKSGPLDAIFQSTDT